MLRLPFFVMSLSGNLVVVLYGLFYPVIKRHVSIVWQKNILKIAIFFYLFPLPLCKKAILSFICNSFPIIMPDAKRLLGVWILDQSYIINLEPEYFFVGPEVLFVIALIFCMVVISLFILGKQIKRHRAISQAYRSAAFSEKPSPSLLEQFKQIKAELGIKGKVKFITSPLCKTPMTIGVFSPTIVFPAEDTLCLEPDDRSYILKHELLHIKNGDTFTKLLLIIVLALHWYNPLCYLLYHEVSVVCEMKCDREVIKNRDDAVRQEYSRLILALAAKNSPPKEKFAIGFVRSNTADYERRIVEMKADRSGRLLLSCVMVLTVCLLGFVTSFAYEPPMTMGMTDFTPGVEYTFTFPASEEVAPLPYKYFFEDAKGSIIPLGEETGDTACPHDFVAGTTSNHVKDDDGSCLTTIEDVLRCSVCGHIDHLDVFVRKTYYNCPHKIQHS